MARANSSPVGVNLAGYFDSALGVGEAARQVRGALQAAGVPMAAVTLSDATGVSGASEAPYPVTLVCANADALPAAHDALGSAFFEGKHVIGLWWWEVGAFPERWLRSFDYLDELWVGSHFVADALGAISPVPVVRVALPLALAPPAAGIGRDALGVPGDRFAFLFVYDYDSVAARKNPLGAIAAYARANPDGAALVLKCLSAERHPEEHAAVLAAAAERDDVHVIDAHLPAAEKNGLMASCDAYLSLHRSEGFGLTLAEAMALGKPVIATDYSGPRDFLTAANGYPVDYALVPVGPGHDPYPADGEWAEPDLDHAAAQIRAVLADPGAARTRAARGRDELMRDHAPAVAGARLAERIARAGRAAGTRADGAAHLDELERRLRAGAIAAPGSRAASPRGLLRRAVLRVLRPQAAHQRMVDEEIARALRDLDERARGLADAQATLAAQIAELRREPKE